MRRPIKNKHKPGPDERYQSVKLARFINYIMLNGKKTVAQRLVYKALDRIKDETGQDPLEVFNTAVENVSPLVEVRSRRVGGANYQIPVEVRPERRLQLALRWLTEAARASRGGKSSDIRIAEELIAASNKEGAAITKRENVHKMAEANKAFAHLAW